MSRHRMAFAALACLLTAPAAQGAVLVTIDKSAQLMTVEQDGRPLYQWPVSTGRAGYDTPGGKFRAFRMERDHFSKEWDDAPMPFSIFFTEKGHAIHGSYEVKRLGSPASHGCVRLAPANAETLFALVQQDGVLNTTVVLTGIAPSGAPAVARRRLPRSDDLEQEFVQPLAPQFGPRYGRPVYNPYYVQPQNQPYGQLPRPGYLYRDPYSGQVYQQPQRPRTMFPFE